MKTLRSKPPSVRTTIAAGCLLCLSLAAPAPRAASETPFAPAAPPVSGGFISGDFDRFRAHARFDRAFRLLAANQLDDAAREFGEGLALDPHHLPARLGYAQLLARRGAFDASVAQLDAVQKRGGPVLSALKLRAQMHAAAGRVRAAIADQDAVARHAEATAAERRFALETAADLNLRIGQYDQALAALDRLPAERSDTLTLARRALIYEKMQRYGEAEAAYRAAASRIDDPVRREQWAAAGRVAGAMAEDRRVQVVISALNLSLVHVTTNHATGSPAQTPVKANEALMLGASPLPGRAAGRPAGISAEARLPTQRDPLSQRRARPEQLVVRGGGSNKETVRLPDESSASTPPRSVRLAALRQLAVLHTDRGAHAEARLALERLVEIDPRDAAGHAALARAHLELGENEAAVQAAQRSLALRKSAAACRLLAFAQSKAGDWSSAAGTYEILLAQPGLRSRERIEALGQLAYALDHLKRYRESATALERAIAEPGGNTMALHERLAHARSQAGDVEGVADAHRRALGAPAATEDERLSVERRLAAVQQSLGRNEEAIETYRSLLARHPEDAQVQLALGTLLRNQGSWPEAEPHLVVALKHRPDAAAALELARGLKANKRNAEAIDVLHRAADAEAAPNMRKQIFDELGYLHEANADPGRAAAAWADSLKIEKDPRIGLALASVQLRAGLRQAARSTLDELSEQELPDTAQVTRLDMLWQLESADGHHAAALDAAEEALALQPSALRRYHAALSERELGRLPEAIAQLERVVAEDAKTEYLDALGYTYRAAGSYKEAARIFEALLQRDPERSALYADLAYTYMRASDNDRALEWFKRAIDKRRERSARVQLAQAPGAPLPALEPPREDENLRAMRDEVRKLSETWSLSAYQSVRSSRGDRPSTVSGYDSSGLIPSQGGVELSWRPPVIGLRDERTLDVFARMLWSNEPRSLKIQSASRQAGIGVRFKPLRDHSLYVSAERLIKVGDNSQNDWLLRASYGWSDGYEMRVNQDAWNYTSLFADVGAFTDPAHTKAMYLEARQGRSFRFGDRWIVTPHVVANGRRQWPDPGRANYAEAGAGVSLRYLFNETAYSTPRSSAELLLQYKKGFKAAKSGWVLTTVLRY